MNVLIRLDRGEPPVGTVLPLEAGSEIVAVPFVGWLGLLRALADLIGQGEGRAER